MIVICCIGCGVCKLIFICSALFQFSLVYTRLILFACTVTFVYSAYIHAHCFLYILYVYLLYTSHIPCLGQRACVGRDLPAHPTGLCSMAYIAYYARISGQ